jgi:hypothetical protein
VGDNREVAMTAAEARKLATALGVAANDVEMTDEYRRSEPVEAGQGDA